MLRRYLTIAGTVGLSFCTVDAQAATLTYNFDLGGDNGTDKQGWTDTRGVSSPAAYNGKGGRGADRTNGEDGQHQNLVFSSPQFYLDGSGPLTFNLNGGEGIGDAPATTFYSNLAAVPNAASTADANGRQYVALRRVSDGAYLINVQRSGHDNQWQLQTITAATLAPFVSATTAYQLDLIETRHGGWGHTEIDDVAIPGTLTPEPAAAALLGIGSLGLLARRRRA